jgi:hypothetical protein
MLTWSLSEPCVCGEVLSYGDAVFCSAVVTLQSEVGFDDHSNVDGSFRHTVVTKCCITLHSLDPKLVKMTVGYGTSYTNIKTHIQYI